MNNNNCITGDNDHFISYLAESMEKATKIDLIVSFIMESGVRLIENDLKEAIKRQVKIRIMCGNYLNITEPQALYLLKDILGSDADIMFYNNPAKSFHPKAYIFEYSRGEGDIFIGSSNISKSALTSGIEWNYRISKNANLEDYNYFKHEFERLYNNHAILVNDIELKKYAQRWRKPNVFKDIEKIEESIQYDDKNIKVADDYANYNIVQLIAPRGAQIEALYELKKTREDGNDKGIVVAATGVGKTYLSAFDSIGFNKILFVAHREEILKQAKSTFESVRPDLKTGIFISDNKEINCDAVFATIQSLSKDKNLCDGVFSKEKFDYIVIDEFHHASADTYKKILDYFQPKFLLGITATPERMDNEDVFALCDYNLVYEIRLQEAINRGLLIPFRYYGIYDDSTDYDQIKFQNGKYNSDELERALMLHKRAALILNHYKKYNSKRALAFCSSRNHAEYMAKYFADNGIKVCTVMSGESREFSIDRKEALEKLYSGEINIIFSVDIFNEGVDIPYLDMLLFLRPTESPTIFLQQLGRGLRKYPNKKYVNVLDFIGNYKRAIDIPKLLTGKQFIKENTEKNYILNEEDYPDGCFVDFDFKVVDILKMQFELSKNIKDRIKDEYFRIKDYIGYRPMRVEMYTYIDKSYLQMILGKREINIFNDYIGFLKEINEITEDEKLLKNEILDFLSCMEKTKMTKTYKMPLLLALYNNGKILNSVSEDEIYDSFSRFYKHGSNAVDLMRDKNGFDFKKWERKEYLEIAQNPIKALSTPENKFFNYKEKRFEIKIDIDRYSMNNGFVNHFKDIIDYKTRRFYKERLEKLEH